MISEIELGDLSKNEQDTTMSSPTSKDAYEGANNEEKIGCEDLHEKKEQVVEVTTDDDGPLNSVQVSIRIGVNTSLQSTSWRELPELDPLLFLMRSWMYVLPL